MIRLLARAFIPHWDDARSPAVRRAYGMLSGIVGILLNLLLCGGKLFAGIVSGSIAVMADALNNLSDAGSSVISLIGFRVAGKRPDSDHPFGHGRAEYVAGLIVAIVIVLMGLELFKSSVEKIIAPEPVAFSWLTAGILVASILVKIYMWAYNRDLSKRLRSPALGATATDSLSDTIATGAALLSLLICRFTGVTVDGWCGAVVSAFVLLAGCGAARDAIVPLLGRTPDREFIQAVEREVLSHPEITGIHDLIVHDYGPGRQMVSLHAEVPADGDLMTLHDAIDRAERDLQEKLRCSAVIHMDPVEKDAPMVAELKRQLLSMLRERLGEAAGIHDFRLTAHGKLVFDVLIPHDCPISEADAERAAQECVQALPGEYAASIQVDRAYV